MARLQEQNLRTLQTPQQFGSRRNRIADIADRYVRNILQTRSGRNGTNRWMQASADGNQEKAKGLVSELENKQYGQRTYMGLSNG